MTSFEICAYKGIDGSIIYREIGLRVSVIITKTETFIRCVVIFIRAWAEVTQIIAWNRGRGLS